jgi:Arm DNA-binding domain
LGPEGLGDMARSINKLSARAAETLSKPGRHSDGGGLYLSISGEGRRRWVFPFRWRGKIREAGLGSASKVGVSLKAARDKAAEGRALVKEGIDPIAAWNKPDAEAVPTFGKVADDYLDSHKAGWRNEKHRAQCAMTLTRYCEPMRNMGKLLRGQSQCQRCRIQATGVVSWLHSPMSREG